MKPEKSRLSLGGLTLLVCGMLALSGFFVGSAPPVHAATLASVRIIHASPFVGSADIFVDGNVLLQSFGFGEVTDYKTVPQGAHKIQIAVAAKVPDASTSVLTKTLSVQPGGVYTIAAIGTSLTSLSLQVFNDNNLAASGTAKARIYQLSPDGGWMTPQVNGHAIATGADYRQASNYFTLSPGSATFLVNSDKAGKSLTGTTPLAANTVTSIFVVGVFNPGAFNGEPGSELVPKQVAAVPGLPQTGSNPFAFLSDGQLSTPWLLIALAMLIVGSTFFTRRLSHTH